MPEAQFKHSIKELIKEAISKIYLVCVVALTVLFLNMKIKYPKICLTMIPQQMQWSEIIAGTMPLINHMTSRIMIPLDYSTTT